MWLQTGLVLLAINLFGKERLSEKFCISYGNPKAKICIYEYFSFICPQCISTFRKDFFPIKKQYIDKGEVLFIFHPDPADLVTIQGMICLSLLSNDHKKIFLETVLPELEDTNEFIACELMKKAVEVLSESKIPSISRLGDEEFIKSSEAFKAAYFFLLQQRFIKGIPTVEINGEIFEDFPDEKFLIKKIEEFKAKDLK